MDKTAVVAVIERVRHPRYAKFVQRTKKLYVHDETNDARPGDRVRVQETRPLSKLKRWRIVEVLERAKLAEGEPQIRRSSSVAGRQSTDHRRNSNDPAREPPEGGRQQRSEGG